MFRFLFLSFLFFVNALANNLQSPSQKLADTPKDSKIQITTHDGKTLCLTPTFTGGEGYVYADYCKNAKPARYDVFYRVAWNVSNVWLCMSAPSNVIDGKAAYGYVLLRPCVLNDKNQQWRIKDRAFYTFDLCFKMQDYRWYGYLSKNLDGYNHQLKNMQSWIDTLAAPPTLSLKSFIGWSFISPTQFSLYYLQNNQSFQDDLVELIYNPENGHIAQYNPSNGSLACMATRQNKRQDWNWVVWASCNDKVFSQKESLYWEFFALVGSESALRDREGNILRLAQYGPNWGVPYTAKPSFLQKDTTNSPKSLFLFNADIERWNRYVNSNLSDSLHFCPAPGQNLAQKQTRTRFARSLPPDFSLNKEWQKRLYQIAQSNDGGSARAGLCGVCLLQSFQIIAELEHYHAAPLSSGGYFFDTRERVSPFESFRARYGLLAQRLDSLIVSNIPLETRQSYHARVMRNFEAMAETMLPNYTWRASGIAENVSDGTRLINTMLQSALGSLWILNIYTSDASGNVFGHAMPVLRSSDGLVFIPTNLSAMSFESYERYFAQNSLARNATEAFRILTPRGRTLSALSSLQLTGMSAHALNISVSNNNCSGEGEDRHGNGALPASFSINQCFSGRCVLQ